MGMRKRSRACVLTALVGSCAPLHGPPVRDGGAEGHDAHSRREVAREPRSPAARRSGQQATDLASDAEPLAPTAQGEGQPRASPVQQAKPTKEEVLDELRSGRKITLTVRVGPYHRKASWDDYEDGAVAWDAVAVTVLSPEPYSGRVLTLNQRSDTAPDAVWLQEGCVLSVAVNPAILWLSSIDAAAFTVASKCE